MGNLQTHQSFIGFVNTDLVYQHSQPDHL